MHHFNKIICLGSLITTAVSSYRIEFLPQDLPEWHGDISTQCFAPTNPESITSIQIIKDQESDSSSEILLSSSSDCSDTHSVRLSEGLHSIQELYPDIESMSLKVVSRKTWRDTVDSISTPSLVLFTTSTAVVTLSTVRYAYGEAIASAAAIVGRPLWAFASSPFITSLLVAQGVAQGTAYVKNRWDTARACEKLKDVQPKLDLLRVVSEVAPLAEIEDAHVILTLKNGKKMNIKHSVPEDNSSES